jgi:methylated-DNA-[protein]-cysteine S-methyltransferase
MHVAYSSNQVESISAAQVFESPIGPLRLRAAGGSLVELGFHHGAHITATASREDARVLDATRIQLEEYFAGRRMCFDIPLRMHGPAFHQRVWEQLLQIPYGSTVSYGWIASRLGDPGLSRAVGTANGANPIAIVVPCHRVIGADGSLVGYGGGLRRKQALLDLESGRIGLGL